MEPDAVDAQQHDGEGQLLQQVRDGEDVLDDLADGRVCDQREVERHPRQHGEDKLDQRCGQSGRPEGTCF